MMLVPLGLLGQSSSVHSFHLRPLMQRILLAVSVIALLFGSLITFPAYLPWMTFVWIVLALISRAKGRVMWPWLLGCVAVMIVKRPGCAISIWGFVIVLLAVAVWDWWGRPRDGRKSNRKKLRGFAALLLSAVACLWIGSWFDTNTSKNLVADGRPIACLGDSLTDFGYPQELEKLISSPVADFGVNGITTDDGIEMIPEILAVDPQAIVIELGGHDYNADNKTRQATRANLVKLIEAFHNHKVEVILVEIPRGFISDPYDGLERELAAEYDLQLVDDTVIRSFIFNSPLLPPGIWLDPSRRYSKDGLHPNQLGNEYFARVVCRSLESVFGKSILDSGR